MATEISQLNPALQTSDNARLLKYFAQYYGKSYAQAIWNFDLNPIVGYDKAKTYCDNLSVIEVAIIPLTLDVFFRKKQDVEESVIIDQYPGIPETTPIIL